MALADTGRRVGALLAVHPLAVGLLVLAAVELAWLNRIGFFAGEVRPVDPDTMMRLAIARDMLANGWQRPILFLREDAPFGMVLHWSSLFFWIILAASKLLWFLDPVQALNVTGIFTGPAIAMLSFVAAFWLGRPLLSPMLSTAYGFSVVFCPALFGYSRPGTANHHPLMVLMTLILLGTAIRCDRADAGRRLLALTGFAAGLGLWISFEAMPFIELFWLYLSILWIGTGNSRIMECLLWFTTALCATALAGLLIDPPYGGYASVELDRISLPYIFVIGLQLACVVLCRLHSPSSRLWRATLAGILAVSVFVIELTVFPAVRGGPVSQFNPFVRSQWMTTIAEMRPVTSTNDLLLLLGNGVIGIAVLMWLPVSQRWKNNLYLCGLMGLGLLTCRYIRFSPYLWITGSLAAFHALHRLRLTARGTEGRLIRVLTPLGAVLLVFGSMALADPVQWDPQKRLRYGPADCRMSSVLPTLQDPSFLKAHDTSPIFVTSLDQSSELLFYTGYRTLAGNYHSDPLGINDSYLMMRDFGWSTAHSVVEDHGIEFLLLCPSFDRARYGTTDVFRYARLSTAAHEYRQPTFYTRIMDGTLPPWLVQRQWPEGVKTDLKLFQVVEPPSAP